MSKAIQSFWEIVSRHHKLFSIPDNDKDEQMMEALRALQQIDSRLYFHCGYHDEGMDFLLSAEAHYELSGTIVELVEAAPEIDNWRIRPILESRALSGERDTILFPDDENGDILFSIAKRAGDLIRPAEVDFCHVFPTERAARAFASLLTDEFQWDAESYDGRDGYSWQVVASAQMIPSHDHITSTEVALAEMASKHDGSPDGWGFMSS